MKVRPHVYCQMRFKKGCVDTLFFGRPCTGAWIETTEDVLQGIFRTIDQEQSDFDEPKYIKPIIMNILATCLRHNYIYYGNNR